MGKNAEKKRLIESLMRHIEEMLGRKVETPKDFDRLSTIVFNRTGLLVSNTTLKRIWGYIKEPLDTRTSTLSILANCLGYKDWETFSKAVKSQEGTIPSSPLIGRRLNVLKELDPGNFVKLTWHPGRKCIAKYSGDGCFEVIESENTRLKPTDTFLCYFIIACYPLYLSELKQGDKEPIGYICGRGEGGVQFEIL